MFKKLVPRADKEKLKKQLYLRENQFKEFNLMLEEALKIAVPKSLFKTATVEMQGEEFVVIDGIKYKSRILSVNLTEVKKVFPYITTAGIELQNWAEKYTEILADYWADSIQEEILRNAVSDICGFIDKINNLEKSSEMNPGSLKDWPIEEQQQLFEQFSDIPSEMKIELTKSMLIFPPKTITGIRFSDNNDYENCQLCPRENCITRCAKYNPNLFEERYQNTKKICSTREV
ncbi:hypothetical protein [Halanaerobium hydrogeniformans]|uniref:Vitamin B12 dependent methionine synthase activation region n=1 Tax=Halanaerobium hydrogeniformans TaxID=656519 RepID=E4RMD3_HALHG|nr:hypothetical protein [Halanaerobium hydrogeniformans]ADQ14464.1 hypothetical protein Halsa_1023 [Halanaerobium hydrogeniformans]